MLRLNGDAPFCNQVIAGYTEAREPLVLLKTVKDIEQQLGREKRGYWAPREIDIDLLDYSGMIFNSELLDLPHPQMLRRAFVMQPLAEILPGWLHPVTGKTAHHYAQTLQPGASAS